VLLRSGFPEASLVADVLVPVQDEVRRQDAPTRDRRDIGDISKRAHVRQESNDAQTKSVARKAPPERASPSFEM
jgi:hypothetical protein